MKNEAIAFGFDTMSGANQFKRKFPDSEAVQIVKMKDGSKKHIVTLEPFPMNDSSDVKKAAKFAAQISLSEAKLSRKEQIIADAERRLNYKIKELQYQKMKKEMENEGLWDNIHKKRERIKSGSGERMRKKGEKGAPSADAINRAKAGKTQGSTSEALKPQQKAMLKRVKARFPRLKPGTQEEIVMLVKPKGQINSKRFVELGQAYDKMDMKKLDQLIAKYSKEDK